MQLRRAAAVLLLIALAIGGFQGQRAVARLFEDDLEKADRLFDEHSYKPALAAYEKVLADGARPIDGRGHALVRAAECERRVKSFDAALKRLADKVKAFEGTIWAGRAHALRGSIALSMPHYRYVKGEQISRGEWIQGAVYEYTYLDDLRIALFDLEEGEKLLRPFVDAGIAIPDPKELTRRIDEYVDLALAMTAAIELHGQQLGWNIPILPSPEIEADYKKIGVGRHTKPDPQIWCKRAEQTANVFKARLAAARARWGEVQYCRRLYERLSPVTEIDPNADIKVLYRVGGPDEKPEMVALPDAMNPFKLFEALIKEYFDVTLIDEAVYGYAVFLNQTSFFKKAVATLADFETKYPKSNWRSDVAALRQGILFPRLEMSNPETVRPGQKPTLEFSTRNVASMSITATRLDAEGFVDRSGYLKNAETSFGAVRENYEKCGLARYLDKSSAVKSNHTVPGEVGDHVFRSFKIELEQLKPGVYLLEADGGGVIYRSMLSISNLAVVRKLNQESTIVFVTDADQGKPVEGADIWVRQGHSANGLFGNYTKMTSSEGKTDARGLFEREHVRPDKDQTIYIEVVARKGDDWAFASNQHFYGVGRKAVANTSAYTFTDRPVYRPKDVVHIVSTIRRGVDLEYKNIAQEKLIVRINDAKGTQIMEQTIKTDEFGALTVDLGLGEEPPLGVYNIFIEYSGQMIGNGHFRVEEYKKPEFEVEVSGGNVKVGDPATIKIHAEYYFGGGVPNSKVAYRIFREGHYPSFAADEPYEFLYGRTRFPWWWWNRPARELVTQGEGKTDELGTLELQLPTADWATRYPKADHAFIVEADITDLSRRTISGSGKVLATNQNAYASIEAGRGFYRAGENAEFEIRTQKADGSPLATTGRVVIYRLTTQFELGKELKELRKEIAAYDASTDASGLGKFKWTADAPGRFAVSYVTKDDWGVDVTAEQAVWVTKPDYTGSDFQAKNVEVVTDQREYRPGDTAWVMINTTFEDSAVFVTLEADHRILHKDVLSGPGRLKVIELPITEAHVPNIFVHALIVRNGQFFSAHREVFVPPVDRFVDVSMKFSKPTYQPGEMASLEVRTTARNGSPVESQVALSVIDRAITYIQNDDTEDIRRFYYGKRREFMGDGNWNSNTSNSLQFAFAGYVAAQPKWSNFRTHGMPPGWYLDANGNGFWGGVTESKPRGGDVFTTTLELNDSDGGLSAEKSAAPGSPAPTASAAPRGAPGGKGGGESFGRRDMRLKDGAKGDDDALKQEESESGQAAATPRTNFADSAAWAPALRTDAKGVARLEFKLPDSLTSWLATARAITPSTMVGVSTAETRTTKNVLIRLQAPRFFTERDEVVLSGIVRNDFDQALDATVKLALDGGTLEAVDAAEKKVQLRPKSELRVDWTVRVIAEGHATVGMSVGTALESDAMTMKFPVLAYGSEKTVTAVRVLKGDARTEVMVACPDQRRIGSTMLEVTMSPSLASVLLESLPYLIEYPYGCTEQTMSRFLPAVVVAKSLKEMGISLEDIAKRRSALENRDALARDRSVAPVYTSAQLERVVDAGLKRLESMQNTDGGWGWWSNDRSAVHLTSYVVFGLAMAKEAGVEVPEAMIFGGVAFLEREVKEETELNLRATAAVALAKAGRKPTKLLEWIFPRRDDLTVYTKAQLALALKWSGRDADAATMIRNLGDFVKEDAENGTCRWPNGSNWWYWYSDEIETNAFMLMALSEIDAESKYKEPLAKWLVANRTGNRWNSTRDTAYAVLGLVKFMKTTGELDPNFDATLSYAGRQIANVHVDRDNMFAFENRFYVRGDAVLSGEFPLVCDKRGKGSLYVTSRFTVYSLEDKITAAGHEIEVGRKYFLLTPYEEEEVRGDKKVKVLKHKKELLADNARVQAGQEIEVELTMKVANNYEYIMIEDPKVSGFEPVALKSGGQWEGGLCSNMELRDERVVFFVTWLQEGSHTLSYRVRAEVPGTLAGMPTRAVAMYAPRLGGTSDSWRVNVVDATR